MDLLIRGKILKFGLNLKYQGFGQNNSASKPGSLLEKELIEMNSK